MPIFGNVTEKGLLGVRRLLVDDGIFTVGYGEILLLVKENATDFLAVQYALAERYYALQDEVRSVEQLRKGAENIMCEDAQEWQPHKTHGMEL